MATQAVSLDFSEPHTLRSEAEYDAAVAAIDTLLELEPAEGTREYDRLEFLSVLVEAYDEEHYRMGQTATPQAVLDFLLEQRGMARAELASALGGRSRVSEFFAGKRPLSITQIQQLRQLFNVSADLLLESPYSR
jgi:HTH-type transcriptional regulator / antitoxin HigA